MSDDNKDANLQSWIEPELEARIVAWVLGEASPFEAAELERILAEKPELGIFKRRMEAVHGLVAAASRMELDPMRMDEGRRKKLLERLGGKESAAAPAVVAMPEPRRRAGLRIPWRTVGGIAACLFIVALLASISVPAYTGVQVRSAQSKKIAEEREATLLKEQEEIDAEPASTMAPPANVPQSGPALPAQTQRLAALDSLKALAQRTVELDGDQDAYNFKAGNAGPAQQPSSQSALIDTGLAHLKDAENSPDLSDEKKERTGVTIVRAEPVVSSLNVDGALVKTQDKTRLAGEARMERDYDLAATDAPAPRAAPESTGQAEDASRLLPPRKEAEGGAYSVARGGYQEAARASVADTQGRVHVPGGVRPPGQVASNAGGETFHARFNLGSQTTDATATQNAPALGDTPILGGNLELTGQVLGSIAPPEPLPQDEISASDQPYSTFSLHVSDVSFLLAKAALASGQLPDPDSIRPEEFYNAFDYCDPAPATGEKFACRIEQAAHPMLQQRNLVRIAMKVADTGRGAGQPLRLTVLLDTSGSMEREDRAASIQQAMKVLTSLLGPKDAVTLIGFARQPRLLAEEVPGDQAGKLVDIVKHTPPEGGTNMEEALKTASELALRHFAPGGQNRVVMLTDGAANLGDADPVQLSKLVERLRQQGISFDACGVGADGLDDDILEALTRKGGGRYYFLNQPSDADQGFARQLAGAFRPAAENVKMQVRFNPDRVGKYRLIGFEKHRLKQEDFRNDKVTAAQLAAEEAAVALYQVQVLPEGEGEIGEVFVRFRDPASGAMTEQSWTIPYDAQAPALDKASPSMQLAATASLVAEKLHGGPVANVIDLDALAPIVGKLRGDYPQQARVRDLVTMFEETRRMTARK